MLGLTRDSIIKIMKSEISYYEKLIKWFQISANMFVPGLLDGWFIVT
jgi:hypothetical protein